MTYTPGIYADISNSDYHADPALGSTSLKTLALKTPAHWKHERDNPVHKDVFDLGTAIHSIVLEQDESNIEEVEASSWQTKKAQEAKVAARAEGKVPLLTKDLELARAIGASVMKDPDASLMLAGHKAEQSVFWEEDGLMLKCRPDALNHGLIADLKSIITADPNTFGKTAADLGYYMSAAHYQDGMETITGERMPFLFILAEKTAPYLPAVVELDEEALEYGRRMNTRAKNIYRRCLETGEYPGYTPRGRISLPGWAINRMDDLLLETEPANV